MKKILICFASFLTLLLFAVAMHENVSSDFFDKPLEVLADGESGTRYYQTMGYCDGVLTYACSTSYTSEYCRLAACYLNY